MIPLTINLSGLPIPVADEEISAVLADDDLQVITVPAGFSMDFASIKVLHNAFLFLLFALVSGYGNYAATIHDWLYTIGQFSHKEADASAVWGAAHGERRARAGMALLQA
jgi:hypothetical protein